MNEQQKIQQLEKEITDLKAKIKQLNGSKKYGLVWEDKLEQVVEDCKTKVPILREVKKRAVRTDKDKPVHILIEGDNYHALSVLNYTHKSKVDIIYIDPPYNTGNKDFIYNDHYVDKDDDYRHSKWLSFMNKRLALSKTLLKDTGVIFISINEDELAHLRLLCDKIFDPNNYLCTFSIKVRHEGRILKGDKDFHEVVEYLLMYKRPNFKTIKRIKDNTSIQEYAYYVKEKGSPVETVKMGGKTVDVFKYGDYEVVKGEPSENGFKKINIRGSIKEGNSSGRFYMKYLDKLTNKKGYLFKAYNMGGDSVGYRYFLKPFSQKRVNGDYFQGVPLNRKVFIEIPYPNYLDFEEVFNTVGYEGGIDFRNGKKPVKFILKLLEIGGIKSDSLVVDFFAGSGTTAHAVLELNKEDGGNRQVILCTDNQDNNGTGLKIAEDICYPRVKKVIKGYTASKGKTVTGLGGNLSYFKTEFVDIHHITNISDKGKIELTYKAGEMIALKENTFEEVEKDEWWQIFKNHQKYTAIYFKEDKARVHELAEKLNKYKVPVALYIFSWGEGEYRDEFAEYEHIRVEDIPEPILKVYKQINSA